jgi:hypothetical protein
MAEFTVNQLLVMKKSLTERRNQLKELVRQSAVTRSQTFGGQTNTEEAKYDVAEVDKRVTEIEMALFHIDGKIKESNAKTVVAVPVEFDTLMSPIKKLA